MYKRERRSAASRNERAGGDVVGCGARARAGGAVPGPGRPSDPEHQPGRGTGGAVAAAARGVRGGLPEESRGRNHRVSLTPDCVTDRLVG